jgi:hypothetical protein
MLRRAAQDPMAVPEERPTVADLAVISTITKAWFITSMPPWMSLLQVVLVVPQAQAAQAAMGQQE